MLIVFSPTQFLSNYYSFKICSPTRSALHSGRYPWGAGFYDMSQDLNHCLQNYTLLRTWRRMEKTDKTCVPTIRYRYDRRQKQRKKEKRLEVWGSGNVARFFRLSECVSWHLSRLGAVRCNLIRLDLLTAASFDLSSLCQLNC